MVYKDATNPRLGLWSSLFTPACTKISFVGLPKDFYSKKVMSPDSLPIISRCRRSLKSLSSFVCLCLLWFVFLFVSQNKCIKVRAYLLNFYVHAPLYAPKNYAIVEIHNTDTAYLNLFRKHFFLVSQKIGMLTTSKRLSC